MFKQPTLFAGATTASCTPARKISYLSTDQVCEDESQLPVSVEILNTIENGSLPPHVLDLKTGVRIMVIRNIGPAAGICDGTRLIVTSFGTSVIEGYHFYRSTSWQR
ncbi:hypothetical protein G6F42_027188 [Rhizopus arrhizus]|nr:hypothetical protein G6F42_027188 [Rhizopus arrhizus]